CSSLLFFVTPLALTNTYRLSLHDALPIFIHPGEHCTGLAAVRAGADGEVHIWSRDPQIREEDVAHGGVVVLAGVDDDVLDVVPLRGGIRDRCELDELRARAHDGQDLHGSTSQDGQTDDPTVRKSRRGC